MNNLKSAGPRNDSERAKRILFRKRYKLQERYTRALTDTLKERINKDIESIERMLTELKEKNIIPDKSEIKASSKMLHTTMTPTKYEQKIKSKCKIKRLSDDNGLNSYGKNQFCKGFQRGFEAGLKALVHGKVENSPIELTGDLMRVLKSFTSEIDKKEEQLRNRNFEENEQESSNELFSDVNNQAMPSSSARPFPPTNHHNRQYPSFNPPPPNFYGEQQPGSYPGPPNLNNFNNQSWNRRNVHSTGNSSFNNSFH